MSNYKKYPKYKESGVEWLGNVPEAWNIKKLKYNSILQTNKVTISNQQVIALENIASWSGKYIPTDSKYQGDDVEFQEDDVLFGKLRPYLAKVYQCKNSGVAFGDILVYRPTKKTESKFVFYAMISEAFIDIVDGSTYGSKMPRASVEFVSNMPMAVAPLQEQQTIANYLDKATAKIDTLIEKQTKLIELLKEKRQAVISTAVTRGLDSTVAMKDSGVEWLGEIPEHWSAMTLKRISNRIVVGLAEAATHAYADEGIAILRATNIRKGKIVGNLLYLTKNFANSPERNSKKIKENDLITVRTGNAGVTALATSEFDGAHCFTMLITTLINNQSNKFYEYYIGASIAQSYFLLEGWGTAQINISVPILQNLPITLPSLNEQQLIVDYLDDKISKIDNLTTKATKAIDLLKEKRTALISSAVTGKIDVREEV